MGLLASFFPFCWRDEPLMALEIPSLLITDDDRAFRETLREVFEPRGFRTLLASDGQEALEIVQRQAVHLLLVDMHMPRLTGLEMVGRMRESRIELPCILVSAALDDAIVEEAKQRNVFSVLAKPVRFSQITATVSEAMRLTYDWPR